MINIITSASLFSVCNVVSSFYSKALQKIAPKFDGYLLKVIECLFPMRK